MKTTRIPFGGAVKILSVNTGKPKPHTLNGQTIETSMKRSPQPEIQIKYKQVVGDEFTSPNLHGIPVAVVYALSADRYPEWSKYLGYKADFGLWGENLTVDVLREEDFFINDEWEVGSALLKVSGPRYPCNRLNFVSGNPNMRDEFADRAWPGVYFEVLREGVVKPGDTFVLKKRVQEEVSVKDLFISMRDVERREPISETTKKILKMEGLFPRYRNKIANFYEETKA